MTDDFGTATLAELRSSEQQTLLDEIDNLRLQGVSEFVFLPQIVVFGDQSSGKSSVLEAISGVPFPHSDTLYVSGAERERSLGFKADLKGLDRFPALVDRAKSEMGLTATGRAFSKNILRVEIYGPDQPKLTVVDLPGLIQTNSKQQSEADVELISDIVMSYMRNQRSVILAVVSAKNDYANQVILKRAQQVDPKGSRTLGLITKPGYLPDGSESQRDFVKLASNENIHFRLGRHIVRNRDYKERDWTTAERDENEKKILL
ncbi:hypothetical protein VTN00DRAFT_853 [Thermoascus crustaceus]|uniref:uncharacterized protein n=1 Tax=Thermoascus crustaceus TaxID=5088 RepID=UPI003744928A